MSLWPPHTLGSACLKICLRAERQYWDSAVPFGFTNEVWDHLGIVSDKARLAAGMGPRAMPPAADVGEGGGGVDADVDPEALGGPPPAGADPAVPPGDEAVDALECDPDEQNEVFVEHGSVSAVHFPPMSAVVVEWVGPNGPWMAPLCGKAGADPSVACCMYSGGNKALPVLDITGPVLWKFTIFKCINHKHVTRGCNKKCIMAAAIEAGVRMEPMVFVLGRHSVSRNLLEFIWTMAVGAKLSAAQVRERIVSMWSVTCVATATPEQGPQISQLLLGHVPCSRLIREWVYALWASRCERLPLVPMVDYAIETQTLSFDWTYRVGSGVYVPVVKAIPSFDLLGV